MIRNILTVIAVCATVKHSVSLGNSRRSSDTLQTSSCGVAKINLGLIVNGQPFERGAFPWIVALIYTRRWPHKFFCGGTLVSKNFVITAAHCILQKNARERFLKRDILALFGAHDLNYMYEAGRITHSPKEIFIHDDWNHLRDSYDADVSLLEFDEGAITFGAYIQPICLWDSEDEPSVADGVVIGWGKSENPTRDHENVPKLIKASIQTNGDCFLDAKDLVDLSSKRTFCAGQHDGSGVCTGDSGGGFFFKVDGVYHLKGIVSSSLIKDNACDVSINAVYTNVFKFKDWIQEIIGSTLITSTKRPMEMSTQRTLETSTRKQLLLRKTSTVRTSTERPGIAYRRTTYPTVSVSENTKFSGHLFNDPRDTTYAPLTFSAYWEVSCNFVLAEASFLDREVNTCRIEENIDKSGYEHVLKSNVDVTVERFYIRNNKAVKYLPKHIGEKFPNLKMFETVKCGLTFVRDYYFKNMKNLRYLNLYDNHITTIEPKAFDDLVHVESLSLSSNLIQTFDGNLFDFMKNLNTLYLNYNKITFLSSETFVIPHGKLRHVDLQSNACVSAVYETGNLNDFNQLKNDLKTKCNQITKVFRKKQTQITINQDGNTRVHETNFEDQDGIGLADPFENLDWAALFKNFKSTS